MYVNELSSLLYLLVVSFISFLALFETYIVSMLIIRTYIDIYEPLNFCNNILIGYHSLKYRALVRF